MGGTLEIRAAPSRFACPPSPPDRSPLIGPPDLSPIPWTLDLSPIPWTLFVRLAA